MNEARIQTDNCAVSVPSDWSAYRAEVMALRNQSTGRRRSLANILARQLLELERDPDRPGLRDLAMQTIRRLASA